jgi:hypothetical protein
MIRLVGQPDFEPREGGVKIVFDVSQELVDVAIVHVSAAGFQVRRYYPSGNEPGIGGSAVGYVRLGAERALSFVTESEQAEIVTAFEAVSAAWAWSCTVIGVDTWTAGGCSDGLTGVREPRRPLPSAGTPGAEAKL